MRAYAYRHDENALAIAESELLQSSNRKCGPHELSAGNRRFSSVFHYSARFALKLLRNISTRSKASTDAAHIIQNTLDVCAAAPLPMPNSPPLASEGLTIRLEYTAMPIEAEVFIIKSRMPTPRPFSSTGNASEAAS